MPDTLFFVCLFCVTTELCVAVCCSVLHCVAVCCSSSSLFSYLIDVFCVCMPYAFPHVCLSCVTIELCAAVCCSVLQRVAALDLCFHVSYMYFVFVCLIPFFCLSFLCHYRAARCSVLQCVAVCCSVLQSVAACCSVLQLLIFIFISYTCISRVYALYFPLCMSFLCDYGVATVSRID